MVEQNRRQHSSPETTSTPEFIAGERKMLRSFHEMVRPVLEHPEIYQKDKDDKSVRIGFEFEYSVLDEDYKQASQSQRDRFLGIKYAGKDFTAMELGAAQLEWTTDPIDITTADISSVENEAAVKERILIELANNLGLHLLRSGSNPLLPIADIVRSAKEKYIKSPDYHNEHKRPGMRTEIGNIEDVDVRDAAIVSILNSVQCNIEAKGFEDAIDKLNRSFAIGPMAVAMSGNSRFLEIKDTGLSDTRMTAWEISHDDRTQHEFETDQPLRIGLPTEYYTDMKDYFGKIARYPFILRGFEVALYQGIGLNWRDTRVKVVEKSLVVEFRPVSMQPTIKESVALMLFYLGRLMWSRQQGESLLDLKLVKQNRDQATKMGLNALLWTQNEQEITRLPATDVLLLEIERSQKGLETAGISTSSFVEHFDILKKRIKDEENPSDRLAKAFYTNVAKGMPREKALILALNDSNALT